MPGRVFRGERLGLGSFNRGETLYWHTFAGGDSLLGRFFFGGKFYARGNSMLQHRGYVFADRTQMLLRTWPS